MTVRWLAAALLGLTLAGVALADDGMRCGKRLVSLGESEAAVSDKCGPPSETKRDHVSSWTRGGKLRAVIDTWTYDRGPNEFVRILTFENGVLRNVEVSGYGTARSGANVTHRTTR